MISFCLDNLFVYLLSLPLENNNGRRSGFLLGSICFFCSLVDFELFIDKVLLLPIT